jgi:hypothetical protein
MDGDLIIHGSSQKNRTDEKPIPIQPNCPVICDAGFFDNRYANTTLIFHKSEKQGKGLDLGFRDNN